MFNISFEQFACTMKSISIDKKDALPESLKIFDDGKLSSYYAPFDYINKDARIVICGITPGLQQAVLALQEASRKLKAGCSVVETKLAAKETASFGGPMRANLIRMLDYISLPEKLGIKSASDLFGDRKDLVHYTSALRYPVFVRGKNYSGTPSMLKTAVLKQMVDDCLAHEVQLLSPQTLFVPLGSKAEEALLYLVTQGVLNELQILSGMPHPSGANAERISYFLDEKEKQQLSAKTNPDIIDANKAKILSTISAIKI
ncbi:hypothetical protein [Endozoicomonas atrinae]|uniref:hypothetical protein n=1 Tax=Endozoicomonas atrinae TaxID=1333660 RepID=UPI0008265E6D|nr:hypothetical protein [Endozoicomonas atrinae]